MRALFGQREWDSPFVHSVRRVGGVNGKFSGKCQSILVMSNLFFARTTKFLQQIADVFWRYLTILKATKTYAWSWLHLLMLGCISSMPPIIWKGMGHSFSRAAFSCYPGCGDRKLRKYHSCCSGNCWWQCCALQSINGKGESLYPARLPILSPEVQGPVSQYSTSFQSCAPQLPCTGASPE